MRFYFPDSQDLISPTYDFLHDEYSPLRVRQRDDLYAHEVLTQIPYDGILVSKAIVDGSVNGAGKYTQSQRQRLYRRGVRSFFRLPDSIATIGDCGAFNYVSEHEPPYTVNEVIDFYEGCGFDAGISVDHVILGYDASATDETVDPAWKDRQNITLRLANDFLEAVDSRRCTFEPVASAQGWSPQSYADSVRTLQELGYQRIALGGMVPLKTPDILACLEHIEGVRRPGVELHLLGITRVASMELFAKYGVTSFDSTSAFRQSFMDDRDNYHTEVGTYVAVRVPQVEGNVTLKRAILAGHVSQRDALLTERECLNRLRCLDEGQATVDEVITVLADYEAIIGVKKSRIDAYRRTLEDTPWRYCQCGLCAQHGVEMIIFRGTERNKRRGFHNLSVLAAKMHALPAFAVNRKATTQGSARG
ncbi:hypothetical protein K1T35_11395 [Pseudonocardia sp. DSM 110487]|uniref:tRNA-guanine transglycosylase DpdA n=1 Tax=Pseudonocardia sp. DSM 110487 TaxID=2865833 RepID=UPI001C69BB53|nr:tRNA-guanine transglycosylase DpdA [Pseudonocardia sp. DSM 110487]QYN37784.1 hypothetical protein K1T35_11395 [Pseudonocardia sp. DSM 110487]